MHKYKCILYKNIRFSAKGIIFFEEWEVSNVVSHGLFLFFYSRRLGLVMLYAFGTSWMTILFESFFEAFLVLFKGCSSTYYHSF